MQICKVVSISITDLGETLADFAIWDKNADSNGLMVSKNPFYLRLSVVDKDGNPVTDLRGFTLKKMVLKFLILN